MEEREGRVSQWITNYDVKMNDIKAGVVPFSCGAIGINHKYKILYVRQLKSGSTLGLCSMQLMKRFLKLLKFDIMGLFLLFWTQIYYSALYSEAQEQACSV